MKHIRYQELLDLAKKKVIIVAEISVNHCGSVEEAKKIIFKAKELGADMVKFQKRDVLNFYPKEVLDSKYNSPFGETFKDYRLGIEFGKKEFEEIDACCKNIGIPWFASALDQSSIDFLLQFNPALIKIPGTVSNDIQLYKYLSTKSIPSIVLSSGGCDLKDVENMLSILKEKNLIFLLQTSNAYPPPFNKVNLGVIDYYKTNLSEKYPNIIPGYSSHELEEDIPSLAVACGARMIEKHFTLSKENWIHSSQVAFTPDQMKKMILNIRRIEKILGNKLKCRDPIEKHKYDFRSSV